MHRLNPRRALAGGAVALLMVVAFAAPAQAGFVERMVRIWDPSIGRGLAYEAQIYRVLHNVPAARNVAVFRYRLPNGDERTLAIDSEPWSPGGGKHRGEGHSEGRLDLILERWGIDPEWVIGIYSELEPCSLPGFRCRDMIETKFTELEELFWSLEYPYDDSSEAEKQRTKAIRDRSVDSLRDEVRDLRQRSSLPGGRSRPRGKAPFGRHRGRLPVLTPRFIPRLPGGIDFTTMELRYVSDSGRRGMRYAFRGAPSAATSDPNLGLQAAGQASDALFAWLALPPQSFWVNLNPSEPDRVIDPGLARTDAGRVLLEADLLLKKTTVGLINPDTPLGDQFWDELERIYGERAPQACTSFRVWIVPEPATVREDGDELYILDAPLTVKTQSMQLVHPSTGTVGCPQESPAVEAQKEDLMRRLILPSVIQAVNTAPAYAPLRRVYASRVAAEWLRRRSGQKRTPVAGIVDSGDVDRWATETPWDPQEVFARYVDSLRKGEWTAKRKVQVGDRSYERTLIYGGVDFSRTPREPVSRDAFKAQWPGLASRVRRSQREPAAGNGNVWLGSGPAGAVRLRLSTPHRRVRPGDTVRYRLRVSNPTRAAVHDVRVCDRLPSDLRFVRSRPRARVQVGWRCWEIPRIGAHRRKTIRFTARALNGARGRAVTRATATLAESSSGIRARHAIRVAGARAGRPGGVTG